MAGREITMYGIAIFQQGGMTFLLDGNETYTYQRATTERDVYTYDEVLFHAPGLDPNIEHTLDFHVVSNTQNNGGAILFDYARVLLPIE